MARASVDAGTVDSGTQGQPPDAPEHKAPAKEQVHYVVAGRDGPARRYDDPASAAQAFAAADAAGRPFVVRVSRLGREAERSTHIALTSVVREDGKERYTPSFAQQADPAFMAAYRAIHDSAQPARRTPSRTNRKRAQAHERASEALQTDADEKSPRVANEVDPESAADRTPVAPSGAFTFEAQSVTAIRYQGAVKDGRLTQAQLTFLDRASRIGHFRGERAEVLAILGERNLAQIESAAGERDSAVRGVLKGPSLHAWHATLAEIERPAPQSEAAAQDNAIERDSLAREADAPASSGALTGTTSHALPAQIERRFIRVSTRFYFPDNSLAFVDGGTRLKARSENIEVIRALVQIAQARGWTAIRVSGSERFRSRVWGEAARQGLSVRGYVPSQLERAQLARDLAEHAAPAALQLHFGSAAQPEGLQTQPARTAAGDDRAARRPMAHAGEDARSADSPSAPGSERTVLYGTLLEAGEAPYRFDAQARPSAFIRLATESGERVLWGIDFPRALAQGETQPQLGDSVGVQYLGRRPVTVKVPVKGEDGAVAGHEDVAAHRNTWLVEKPAFFAQREARAAAMRDPGLQRTQLAQSHPELAGALAWLHLAQQLAAERIADPDDQARFVAMVREGLAQAISRSQPVPPPKLRVLAPQRGQDETAAWGGQARAAAEVERAVAR